ncbi:phosphate ABC transporter permease subunit PstC [Natrinema limicola]|uniref:Phosphate transport system permease protein n=1 Tax=Natrinema limicola JCM 13563 TaxID=1230457 RepID=M0C498_9EURY|nr:phosphate ABC transporter permease subunit PstC [Natrinema limicola]ELZ18111.1 phosphate ABC transporter membrane protein 1, phot family [Natrinema limicola JCM 13563]
MSNTLQRGDQSEIDEGDDRRESLLRLVAGASLGGSLLTFLVAPWLTVFFVIAFLAVVGYGWFAYQERTAKGLMFLATVSTALVLVLIIAFLFIRSLPAFGHMGLEILYTDGDFWSRANDWYSLYPAIWGTGLTTILATIVAAPLGIASAIFISEIAPPWAHEIVKPAVETLAGIPSIVYGFIGFTIINGYMMDNFGLTSIGSIVVVGVVVGLMALPTVASVAEDAIASVPDHMKDGAAAIGATKWQTIKSVTIPASFSGVSAAVLLGVGRAVGETMAATVILGNVMELPEPLYNVFGNTVTLTSLIASQYGNSHGLHREALFAAGVILFITVMALSVTAQVIEARVKRNLGGDL